MGKISLALEKSVRQKASAAKQPSKSIGTERSTEALPARQRGPLDEATPRVDPKLITLSKEHSFATEQFRLLKTHLRYGMGDPPPRSIMITSALPGEGKSFVATNLAVSFAQNIKEHVLVIDCDLRRPSVHRIFGLNDPEGLSEYLQNGKDLSEFLIKTGQNKLTLLPAGRPPGNPLELLSSEKMMALLKEVKDRYSDRFVFLDSPPPLMTADANALVGIVDTVLLVVKKNGAGRELVSDLVQNIGKDKIAGVVFNHFEISKLNALGYGKYGKIGKYRQYYR